MQVKIDLDRAQARHPEIVSALLADMGRKLKRAKVPFPDESAFEWRYSWGVRITGVSLACILGLDDSTPPEGKPSNDPLDNCYPCLELIYGKRCSSHYFCVAGPDAEPMPRDMLPAEIVKAYAPKPVVDPDTYPHVASFMLHNPNGPNTQTELATSGYRSKRGVFIHRVAPGDDLKEGRAFEILYRIDADMAVWSGSLIPTAKERFDATPEGEVFRYRNAPLTRLTSSEVRELVQGRTFTLAFP